MSATALALIGCSGGGGQPASVAPAPRPPINNPPTISGQPPQEVVVGNNYAFTPTASDPEGAQLTFSIQNKPAWASFEASSGTLAGLASPGTEGTYENIQISVSDGSTSASIDQFAIEVTQIALGSTILSWTPPTENEDGGVLTDLDSYKIYFGTMPGNYTNQIHVDNGGISSYVVENLVPDTYYFVATAVNTGGIESSFSNEATKTIN